MSIVNEINGGYVLDHSSYINKIYNNVDKKDDYCFNPVLFNIWSPFKMPKDRKRKRINSCDEKEREYEVTLVKNVLDQAIKCKDKNRRENDADPQTKSCIDLSKEIFNKTNITFDNLKGGNNSNVPLKCKIKDEFYLIPPACRFLCGEVQQQISSLTNSKFDIVIADPPWWNKYIRRLKTANPSQSYSMMYNEDIASIPLAPLLSDDCLVAVWCTNSPANISAVLDTIFPRWGVAYKATWYWLKVTKSMEPVCSFGVGHMKQPYERIIIGSVGDISVPDKQVLVSVPSALHSHKPPLIDVLSRHSRHAGSAAPRVLELFARYLLPATTSVGYEPLKWQHISLYNQTNKVVLN